MFRIIKADNQSANNLLLYLYSRILYCTWQKRMTLSVFFFVM